MEQQISINKIKCKRSASTTQTYKLTDTKIRFIHGIFKFIYIFFAWLCLRLAVLALGLCICVLCLQPFMFMADASLYSYMQRKYV